MPLVLKRKKHPVKFFVEKLSLKTLTQSSPFLEITLSLTLLDDKVNLHKYMNTIK